MKILVFSDSHGNMANMKQAVEHERPDRMFHLGDGVWDAQELAAAFPDIPLDHVCGNCDYPGIIPNQRIVAAGGIRILLTHGHLYHVKLGMGAAVEGARQAEVNVLAFGHTHQAICTQYDDLWVLNPGSIRGGSYGLIEVRQGTVTCHLMELEKEG